ncbi:MAG: tetratricopeptide repeat protein [Deltaproteobacteria bacterium]|jgi:tetratricopeptide (TPR) repeat protein|nr:tetratricopeptide repeat protein [Deltaproteobacteria bacterium]
MNNLILMAEEAYLLGRPQEAIGLLAKVISEEPSNIRALSNIGVIFHAVGQYRDAKIAFEKVLAIEPANNDMRKNYVLTLLTLKDYKEAKKSLEILLAVNQNDFQLWTLLGKVEASLNNTPGAIAAVERSLLLNPEQPEIQEYLNSLKSGKDPKVLAAAQAAATRIKNLCIFSMPDRESETDFLSEGLSKDFRLERIASVKTDPYLKALPFADIVYLDGINEMTLFFLNSKDLLLDKTVFLRVSRDDMEKDSLKTVSYTQVNNLCFESFFFRDTFMNFKLPLNPGTKLHVIRKCVDTKTLSYSEHNGKDKICSVISESATPGDLILCLEAFLQILKINKEAKLHLHVGKRDMSKERYLLHYLSLNSIEKKVFYTSTSDTESLSQFLGKNDYFLTTEVIPGVNGLLESILLGLKPLIRFTLGQNEYSPENTLWKNFTELLERYQEPPDGKLSSQIVFDTNGAQKLKDFYIKALTSGDVGA